MKAIWCLLLAVVFSRASSQKAANQPAPNPYVNPLGEDIREKYKGYPKILTKKEAQNLIRAYELIRANKPAAAIPLLEPLFKRAPKDKVLYLEKNALIGKGEFPVGLEPSDLLFSAYYRTKQWKKLYPLGVQRLNDIEGDVREWVVEHNAPPDSYKRMLEDSYGFLMPILEEARKHLVGANPSKVSPLVLAPKSPRLIDEPSVKVRGGQILITADVLAQQLGLTVEADNAARKVRLASKEKDVTLSIGENNAKSPPSQDPKAVRLHGQLMLPLRYVAEAFGVKLKWDEKTRIAQLLPAESHAQTKEAKPQG